MSRSIVIGRRLVVALALLPALSSARADTGTALGDRTGEGSTPFTGLAQAPEANLFTGALTTSIPIEVPPGRRGMTPQLALQYSSAGGPSPFGVGWDVPIGRIERSTTWGVPRCVGAHTDDFVLTLPTGVSDLVRDAPNSNFYRPAVEQTYVRAEKFAAQNSWVVYDRSGVKYTFGDTDSARVGNSTPLTFLSQAADGTCQLTTTWALTRIEDPNGNIVEFSWAKILNVLYPINVRYGGSARSGGPAHAYTIRFLPEWRPEADRIVSYRNGVPSRLVWRIYAIHIETDVPATGTLVREYTLGYRDGAADGAAEGLQSLLSTVGVTGRPTQHFAYTASVTGHRDTLTTIAKPSGAWNELRVVNSSREVSQTLLDMNGDGLLDLVRSDDPPPSSWAVYWGYVASNGSFGFQSSAIAWQAPGNWTHLRNVLVSSGSCNGNGWSCTKTDTFDITGDGIPDHIDAANATNWVVYKGRGVPQWGFAAGVNWPAPNRAYIRRSFAGKTYQDVLDINGDGLPDLVHSAGVQSAPYQWDVYLNTGSGFETARQPTFPAPFKELSEGVQGDLNMVLTDFNGDGLPDLVRAGQDWDPRCQPSPQHLVSCLEVYFNAGQGFDVAPTLIPVPPGAVQDSNQFGDEDDTVVVRDLVDVNGDGLPDWVWRALDDDRWRVLLNLGGTLEPVIYVPSTYWPPPYIDAIATRIWPGGHDYFRTTLNGNSHADLVDVNGDGFLDALTGGSTWTVRLHDARERPNLLGMMENGLGGTNTIVYRPSTAYDNRGGDAQPDLPFINWVVDKTRQNDGQCTPPPGANVFEPGPPPARNPCIDSGNELVMTHHYQDGRFDPAAREFRGFRRVVRTRVEGSGEVSNPTATYFGQDAAANGRILQVDSYAGNTAVVRSEINVWGTRSVGARIQIWLSANHRNRWDLISGGPPDTVSTFSDPPDAYGNITHHYGTSVLGGPRVDTYTTYALPQSGSQVFDRPSSVRITQPSGVLEEKWYYYDGSSADGLALGAVTAGNLKRTRARLTPSNANGPETRTAYDAYGNLTSVTDANGRTTVTLYDNRALYPRGAINALWHVTASDIDYRWAQPTAVYDANGVATRYAYDSAGRRSCVARPGDSLTNCSIRYTYHFASQAEELSWVETAERQDGAHPALTTRHYFDALGRPRYTDTFRVVEGTPTTVRSNHVVYDASGRVRTLYHPYLASAGAPNNGATTYDYHLNGSTYLDPLGRVYRTINADGTVRRTEFAAALTSAYDEDGQRSDTINDPFGRPVTQTAYSGPTPHVTTDRTFDGLGRLLTVRQGGRLLRSIVYDSLGRKTQMTDQDSGTWRYAYDGAGNLRWQDDPRAGRHVEFCYDAINRPTRQCAYNNDSTTLASCSSPAACTDPEAVLYEYDDHAVAYSRGRLTRVEDASGSSAIDEYDQRGRVRRSTRTIALADGSRHARFAFDYDGNDRTIATTYPDGEIVFTEYDDGGQPIALRNQSNAFYVTDALYDIFGRPTRVDHVNGVTDTRTYAGAGQLHRLSTLTAAKGATKHLDLFYLRYTRRGLLEALVDSRNLSGELTNTAVFTYDALGRLTNHDSSYNPLDSAFAYDTMGNLTRRGDRYLRYDNAAKPHQPTTVHVGSPTAPGQLIAHDPNGNRTVKASQSYSYDSSDRLAHVAAGSGEVEFVYDYNGDQVGKTVITPSATQATRFYSPLAETSAGTLTKWYFLGGLRIAAQTSNAVGWETAALSAPSVWLASAPLEHPALIVVMAREASWIAGAALLCITLGLLAAPWRRRPVVGIAVRPSHAVLVALAFSVVTLPWPIAFQAAPASAAVPALRHYHVDHRGSTQVITDANGDIVEQIRYLPYGGVRGHWDRNNVLIVNPGDGNRREFAGYLSEALSGLQYAGARFYDPELGSFLTHDPATQFASPYSYGGGDPVNWSDPSGETFIVELIIALVISAAASAAVNTIIAAAQGLPPGAIGKAALGGAIAGAAGVGLGVVASVATLGAGSLLGSLAPGVTFTSGLQKLGEVAWRSAWSTGFANAAGQSAAAAGAPSDAVTAISMVTGFVASVGYDRVFDVGKTIPRLDSGVEKMNTSTTETHTRVTMNSTARSTSALIRDGADEILDANLARDRGVWNVLNNESHFDVGAQKTFEGFSYKAFHAEDANAFYKAVGGALHHLQDQYALGHMFPGTSLFRGPIGAPIRFLVHNAVGGEITFTQASEKASLEFLESLARPQI